MTEGPNLDAWLRELCEALDLPMELASHRNLILDVARDAAHGVARPAAPLTTFLVGYAAGQAGNAGEAVKAAAAVVTDRATQRGQ
ncbi:MAG: DUF6457 domain-containing protein [Marmoricola sp.]